MGLRRTPADWQMSESENRRAAGIGEASQRKPVPWTHSRMRQCVAPFNRAQNGQVMTRGSVAEILLEACETSSEGSSRFYDEVLLEVSRRAREEGAIGKVEIGALIAWKRLNASTPWVRNLMLMPESQVREVTGKTWSIANDQARSIPDAGGASREILFDVPGCGRTATGAFASAVLVALAPNRMAVWDRRARLALEATGVVAMGRRITYRDYLQILIELAAEMKSVSGMDTEMLPRNVDLALYSVGGDSKALSRLRSCGYGRV